MNDAEFWAKMCQMQAQLSVLETLLLRIYDLMQQYYRLHPPP